MTHVVYGIPFLGSRLRWLFEMHNPKTRSLLETVILV